MKLFVLLKYKRKKEPVVEQVEFKGHGQFYNQLGGLFPIIDELKVHNTSRITLFYPRDSRLSCSSS